jgi:ribosomal protein L29
MRARELREKPTDELEKLLSEKRTSLRLSRFARTAGKAKNVMAARVLKRDIARILTLLDDKNHGRGKEA